MYHQFIKLADIDITKEPMEVGPTTHYVMGGIRVEPGYPDGYYRARIICRCTNVQLACTAPTELGGNSLSDLLVFGKRAGEYAAKFAKEHAHGSISEAAVEAAAKAALAPFERSGGENPSRYSTICRK